MLGKRNSSGLLDLDVKKSALNICVNPVSSMVSVFPQCVHNLVCQVAD